MTTLYTLIFPFSIKLYLKFAPIITCLVILAGCEDNLPDYYNVREHNLQDFTKVDLGDTFQVEIYQSDEFKVFAKGENRDIEDLALRVENNTLTGHYVRNRNNRKRTLVQIYMPMLAEASLHSATSTEIIGFNNIDQDIKIKVGGASVVAMESLWKSVNVEVMGSSYVSISGSSVEVQGIVSGASRLQALSFSSQKMLIDVSGNSEAAVKVYEHLTGTVTGRSKLSYTGTPGSVSVYVSGESELRPI